MDPLTIVMTLFLVTVIAMVGNLYKRYQREVVAPAKAKELAAAEQAAKTIYDCPRYEDRSLELKLAEAGAMAKQDVTMCEESWCIYCGPEKENRERELKAKQEAASRRFRYSSIYSEPYTKPRRRKERKSVTDYWEYQKYQQMKMGSDHGIPKGLTASAQSEGTNKPLQELEFVRQELATPDPYLGLLQKMSESWETDNYGNFMLSVGEYRDYKILMGELERFRVLTLQDQAW